MLSVTNKPSMLTVIKTECRYAECCCASKELVANKHSSLFLLSPSVTKKKIFKHRSTTDTQQCDSDVCSSGVNLIKLFVNNASAK